MYEFAEYLDLFGEDWARSVMWNWEEFVRFKKQQLKDKLNALSPGEVTVVAPMPTMVGGVRDYRTMQALIPEGYTIAPHHDHYRIRRVR